MPYLKKEKPDPMTMLLRAYGLNGNNLEPVLGQTGPTIRKKIRNPDLFTVGDLKKICRQKHIPIEEMRAGITI